MTPGLTNSKSKVPTAVCQHLIAQSAAIVVLEACTGTFGGQHMLCYVATVYSVTPQGGGLWPG